MSEENNLYTKKDIKGLTEEEGENLKAILKHFVESYMKNRDTMELDEWLAFEFKNNLEGISDDEAKKMSDEIIESLKAAEESKASLENAIDILNKLFELNGLLHTFKKNKFIIEIPFNIFKYIIYIMGWLHILDYITVNY